jgi:outer membrane lipoprotein SlyB
MKTHHLPLLLACALAAPVHATTPKNALAMDEQAVAQRYADDRKLCADESDSARRMQCLRDAKTEHDKALAAAKARFQQSAATPGAACHDCGTVTSVTTAKVQGESNAGGLLVGGAAGALLGHQVGKGNGRDLATLAGAVGGAYAGKKVQENMNAKTVWHVQVRYEDGKSATYRFDHDPGFKNGEHVRKSGAGIRHM